MTLLWSLQVVAFQAAMSIMAGQFPGAFAGYTLQVSDYLAHPASFKLIVQLLTYMNLRTWAGKFQIWATKGEDS